MFYLGDNEYFTESKHGNRKKNEKKYHPTHKNTMQLIKKAVAEHPDSSNKKIYQELNKETFKTKESRKICQPTDTKQIANAKYNLKKLDKENKLLDDLFKTRILLSQGLDDFVKVFNISPSIYLIMNFQKIIDFVNFMIDQNFIVEIGYDTTFNCSPYYLTFLVCKAQIFEGDPVFPGIKN